MGPVWTVIRLAATRIPWGRVIENIPAVVDMVNRAKGRLKASASAQGPVDERMRVVEEESLRLGKALLETEERLQELAKALEVLAARQKMLIFLAMVSLATAIAALLTR
jgi:hypothetical protein